MAKLINLADVKHKKMIAMYLKFYGNSHDSQRKATK
jgi:hypothetical protein